MNHQLLPEVVYAYGLKESIWHGFLKEVNVLGYENVKDEGFLRDAISRFWQAYGGKTFEGLTPKMAIFASTIAEATDVFQWHCKNIFIKRTTKWIRME